MDLFTTSQTLVKTLFLDLYKASTEEEVNAIFQKHPSIFSNPSNWHPLGGNDNNYGVIENQQSSPIAALIEKITNSIDAILMKKAYQKKVDPKSSEAPRSMEEAISQFFPDSSLWNLSNPRKEQAKDLQVLADGQKLVPSLTIYDNGEGQHPQDFESTFLSLLRGNKNEIPFVQGKYNMGGTGAIVFCGKKRYQLIASKRFDEMGDFGFTLIRKHPLSESERQTKKNTWYEYLKIDGKIPSFPIKELDLGLYGKLFKTGSIVKLYSYDLPKGSRSVISRDLNQSINEYLFEPALPVYTIDSEKRYPEDRNLQRELYGLKRRLEEDEGKYIDTSFSIEENKSPIGPMKVTCYVFKPKIEGKTVKESRESIQREFFKNNMSVLFSMNGQVHGHYTYEFISRTLKMQLLKHHLLIHVDCTKMNLEFRNELFMASRDRLKEGEASSTLRSEVGDLLKRSRLKEIYKTRRQSLSVEGGNTNEVIKSIANTLPKDSELFKVFGKTLKLEAKGNKPETKPTPKRQNVKKQNHQEEVFSPKRFPSRFAIQNKKNGQIPVIKMPLGGEKTIKFSTDVEDHYFDRSEEPGDLKIALLGYEPIPNENDGGNDKGSPKKVEEILNVTKSSPNKGIIQVSFSPKEEVKVGEKIQVNVTLEGAGQNFDEIFWIKFSEQRNLKGPKKEPESIPQDLGLPDLRLVYEEKKDGFLSWDELESKNIEMNHDVVIFPLLEEESDQLEAIFVNMDSRVLKSYKGRQRNASLEQLNL